MTTLGVDPGDTLLLGHLLDTAPIGLALIDRDLRYVRVNRHLAELNGRTPQAHVGARVADVLPMLPTDALEAIRAVAEGGAPLRGLEYTGVAPGGGRVRTWVASFEPVHDEEGRPVAASAVVIDVTDQRLRERALAHLGATMGAVAGEETPEAIAQTLLREAMPALGARFGLIRVVEPGGETSLLGAVGWGEHLGAIGPYDMALRVPTTDAIRTGQVVVVADRTDLDERYPVLADLYRAVGQHSAVVMPLHGKGGPFGALLLGFDRPLAITDHHRAYLDAIAATAAAALQRARHHRRAAEAQALLDGVLSQLPVGVIVVDAGLHVTFQNEAAARIVGGELPGGYLPDNGLPGTGLDGRVIAPDEWPVVRAVRTGSVIVGETGVMRRSDDGREVVLSLSAAPIRDGEGRILGGVGVAQDITAAWRANEARDAFMGVLSHELRTPLTSIYGGSQVLARHRGELPQTLAPLVDDVASESYRLLRLVEDLLVIARVERGTLAGNREPLLLHHLVERIVDTERQQWPAHRIDVEHDRVVPIVFGDEGFVTSIVRNLIGNAAKYGRRWVGVSVRARGAQVELAVEDDGDGLLLPPDELYTLFVRGNEAERRATGSGIGLFVCRALVESMGGTITALDRPSGGARFEVCLPVAPVDDPEEARADGRS